jgi:8-oxo-(d)GTP phosphatase
MAGKVETMIVLRHAFAGTKLEDPVLEAARGLDELGHATAEALVASIVEHVTPTAIVSSPLRRCLQTVHPLAASVGLEIDRADELRAFRPAEEVRDLLLSLPDGAVVCTHGEVIASLFGSMECEKGAFLVVRRSARLLRPARYVGPPAVGLPRVGRRLKAAVARAPSERASMR